MIRTLLSLLLAVSSIQAMSTSNSFKVLSLPSDEAQIATDDPQLKGLVTHVVKESFKAYVKFGVETLDEFMDEKRMQFLIAFKKAFPEEDFHPFNKFLMDKDDRISKYYKNQMVDALIDLAKAVIPHVMDLI